MLVGHVANNLACNLSRECLHGSRCVSGTPSVIPGNPFPGAGGASGTVTAMPGVCVPYQQAGERCNQTSDCDPRLSCRAPEFACGPRPQQGDPCLFELDMLTGYPISTCAPTLFCDGAFGNNVCRRYPRDGEPCNQLSLPQCDPDPMLELTCNFFSGICRRPGDEGDACGGPAIPPCRQDLSCHPMQSDGIGVCGPVPGLGEPCVDRCVTPAICAGTRCTAPGTARIGEPCTSSTDCATLACTGFQSGRQVCGLPPYFFPLCVGADITPGNMNNSGAGGTFGTGFGGTFGTGFAGTFGTGGRAAGPGTDAGPSLGCSFSNIAPADPIIADFDVTMGDVPIIPIGGTFTYGGSPRPRRPPTAPGTSRSRRWARTSTSSSAPGSSSTSARQAWPASTRPFTPACSSTSAAASTAAAARRNTRPTTASTPKQGSIRRAPARRAHFRRRQR
jgi:hypothetical protein